MSTTTNTTVMQKNKNASATGELMMGAEIFIRSLVDEGVDTIFGYPGGVVLSVYDKLYDVAELNHILVRHEQGGTHAADGYARATGKAGVVLVTSGPGATNTVTGIATAYMDSIPMVVFTGQVPTALMGNDAFQEADTMGITRPVTKHSYLVKDVNELADTVRKAFHIATTGRPGPVLVDLPKDVLLAKTYYNPSPKIELRGYKPLLKGNPRQISKAAEMINKAKKPVLYCGGGVINSNASVELTALAHRLNAPVTTTLLGLGAFPETDPLALGMLGMHGTWYANTAVMECDLLVAIGARFDDRVTGRLKDFSPNSKKIHIDIDPSCISKNVPVDLPIVGDVKTVIEALLPQVERCDSDEWLKSIEQWKQEHPLRYEKSDKELKPQEVIEMISDVTKGEAIVTTDVGQHQMWVAQYYKIHSPTQPPFFRRIRHDGLRFPGCNGRGTRLPGPPGGFYHRRRWISDDSDRNGYGCSPQDPGKNYSH